MKEVSDLDDFNQLIMNTGIVFLDVYATWCGPCKTIAPVFEALASEFSRKGAIEFVKTNVATSNEIAQSLNVGSIPTFVAFLGGQEFVRISGGNADRLRKFVVDFITTNTNDRSNARS
jgi:thioredoxin 1